MKFIKVLAIIAVFIGVIGSGVWHFLIKDTYQIAKVATPFSAKSVCSCRFVAERSMESCLSDFTLDVSSFTFEESETAITVSFSGWLPATALYTPGVGCALIPTQ